jgi:lipopolysaccharide export system permease protein
MLASLGAWPATIVASASPVAAVWRPDFRQDPLVARMKLIDRYLLKDILHYFITFLMIFVVIMLVYEIFDARREFLASSTSLFNIVLFLIVGLPEQIAVVMPIIGLLGTMMAYGMLVKNNEILAMIAAGISYRRLIVPALAFGACFGIFAFWFNDDVVPVCKAKSLYLEKVVIGGRSQAILTRRHDLFLKGIGDKFYYLQEYILGHAEMIEPTILDMAHDGSGLRSRLHARQAKLDRVHGHGRVWIFDGAETWNFNPDGSLASYKAFDAPLRVEMERDLDKFLGQAKKPEDMNLAQLGEYVSLLEHRKDENVAPFQTWAHRKRAFPFSCLLIGLLGAVAVIDLSAKRFARGVLVGLTLAIAYYPVETLLGVLGEKELIPPLLGGWSAVALFALLLLWMIHGLDHAGR